MRNARSRDEKMPPVILVRAEQDKRVVERDRKRGRKEKKGRLRVSSEGLTIRQNHAKHSEKFSVRVLNRNLSTVTRALIEKP